MEKKGETRRRNNALDGADAQFQEAHGRTFRPVGICGDGEVGEGEGGDDWEEESEDDNKESV